MKTVRRTVAGLAAALLLSVTALAACGSDPAPAGSDDRSFPYPPVQYWKRAV